MARSLKLYLLLSSFFICSCFVSCRISKYKPLKCGEKKAQITHIITNTTLKYKASIDVLKNHLTGLIIVKQTDSITKHIVFVTELGMKMFDLEIKNKEVNAVFVFEPLNKPLLVEALKRNFKNMFFINAEGDKLNECSTKKFKHVVILKNRKDKWIYSTNTDDDSPILYPTLQETFHNHKLTSTIHYTINRENNRLYSTIKCKQYGLIKFYFELNEIPKTND